MKYTTYIFDFDFTLADATPGIVNCVNFALNSLNIESKQTDDIRKTVGMTLKETFTVLTGISDEGLSSQFVALFKEMADKIMTKHTTLFDDTIGSLEQLKTKGFKTAIVTSKFHYRIDEVLKKYDIAELIDCIVGFEDVDCAKPSPNGLLKAIHCLSEDRNNVLYVGDSLIDANTAANASVDFAAVTTGTTTSLDFNTLPHIMIAKSLSQLFDYMNSAK
ncbi:MAG: Haloacid dehalogenase-like hydrolase [Paenibacillaceae bacterium]|jgi:phosphoglycolate phosphatase|nr:Haloacid dehalogenase-like hydrolase [Paenibacillaceae bacterium]